MGILPTTVLTVGGKDMSILRVNDAKCVKWMADTWMSGRSSKRIRKVFSKKIDAENYLRSLGEEKRLGSLYGGMGDFKSTTFREEALNWIEMRSEEFSPGHIMRVKRIMDVLIPRFGAWTMDRFTIQFLNSFRLELKRGGRSHGTVNRWTDVITAILNFSARNKRIPFSPANGFRKFKEVRAGITYWKKEEAQRFLSYADGKYPPGHPNRNIYVIYLVALNTGLRSGEVWGLMPKDLLDDGTLRVERQFDRLEKRLRPTKGKTVRIVPCSGKLREELLEIIRARTLGPEDRLFVSSEGHAIDHDNFAKRAFLKDMKEAGVRLISFHDLRHTALTQMVSLGFDIKTVQEIAGHSDIKTTMNYVHLVADNIKKVPMLFESVLTNPKAPLSLVVLR